MTFCAGPGRLRGRRKQVPLTVGSSQHLQNGNTMITESDQGQAIEVTPSRQVVWDSVSTPDEKVTNVAGENVTPGGGNEARARFCSPVAGPQAQRLRPAGPVKVYLAAPAAWPVPQSSLLAKASPARPLPHIGGRRTRPAHPPSDSSRYDVIVLGNFPTCAERLGPWLESARCRFQVGAMHDIPFADGSFDATLAFRLLAHEDRWQVLRR